VTNRREPSSGDAAKNTYGYLVAEYFKAALPVREKGGNSFLVVSPAKGGKSINNGMLHSVPHETRAPVSRGKYVVSFFFLKK
jgi:hypothetical protein